MDADDRSAAAAAWHVRLRSEAAGQSDFQAFEQWLSDPRNREAYDDVDRLWADLDADEAGLAAALADPAEAPASAGQRAQAGIGRRAWFAFAAAAAAAVAVFAFWSAQPSWTTYATQPGQTSAVRLADGSEIHLNRNSMLKVALGANRRRVIMDGEATFDVAPDARRPFLIEAGDQRIRVVGTEFNVLHHEGRTTVTVRRGVVEVASNGQSVHLRAGEQSVQQGDEILVRQVEPDNVFAWRAGRLIYAGATLAEVIDDLNRYVDRPLRVGNQATASLPFSGVLVLDEEDKIVARLEAFLPISATRDADAIVLRRR